MAAAVIVQPEQFATSNDKGSQLLSFGTGRRLPAVPTETPTALPTKADAAVAFSSSSGGGMATTLARQSSAAESPPGSSSSGESPARAGRGGGLTNSRESPVTALDSGCLSCDDTFGKASLEDRLLHSYKALNTAVDSKIQAVLSCFACSPGPSDGGGRGSNAALSSAGGGSSSGDKRVSCSGSGSSAYERHSPIELLGSDSLRQQQFSSKAFGTAAATGSAVLPSRAGIATGTASVMAAVPSPPQFVAAPLPPLAVDPQSAAALPRQRQLLQLPPLARTSSSGGSCCDSPHAGSAPTSTASPSRPSASDGCHSSIDADSAGSSAAFDGDEDTASVATDVLLQTADDDIAMVEALLSSDSDAGVAAAAVGLPSPALHGRSPLGGTPSSRASSSSAGTAALVAAAAAPSWSSGSCDGPCHSPANAASSSSSSQLSGCSSGHRSSAARTVHTHSLDGCSGCGGRASGRGGLGTATSATLTSAGESSGAEGRGSGTDDGGGGGSSSRFRSPGLAEGAPRPLEASQRSDCGGSLPLVDRVGKTGHHQLLAAGCMPDSRQSKMGVAATSAFRSDSGDGAASSSGSSSGGGPRLSLLRTERSSSSSRDASGRSPARQTSADSASPASNGRALLRNLSTRSRRDGTVTAGRASDEAASDRPTVAAAATKQPPSELSAAVPLDALMAFHRSDGGRFSLRSRTLVGAAAQAQRASAAATSTTASDVRLQPVIGSRASAAAAAGHGRTPALLGSTLRTSASVERLEQEKAVWRRRKSYDPRKAVAAAAAGPTAAATAPAVVSSSGPFESTAAEPPAAAGHSAKADGVGHVTPISLLSQRVPSMSSKSVPQPLQPILSDGDVRAHRAPLQQQPLWLPSVPAAAVAAAIDDDEEVFGTSQEIEQANFKTSREQEIAKASSALAVNLGLLSRPEASRDSHPVGGSSCGGVSGGSTLTSSKDPLAPISTEPAAAARVAHLPEAAYQTASAQQLLLPAGEAAAAALTAARHASCVLQAPALSSPARHHLSSPAASTRLVSPGSRSAFRRCSSQVAEHTSPGATSPQAHHEQSAADSGPGLSPPSTGLDIRQQAVIIDTSTSVPTGRITDTDEPYNAIVMASIHRLSARLSTTSQRLVTLLRDRLPSSAAAALAPPANGMLIGSANGGSADAFDPLSATASGGIGLSAGSLMCSTELGATLASLRQVEQNIGALERTLLLHQGSLSHVMSGAVSIDQSRYLAELRQLRSDITGFKPIEEEALAVGSITAQPPIAITCSAGLSSAATFFYSAPTAAAAVTQYRQPVAAAGISGASAAAPLASRPVAAKATGLPALPNGLGPRLGAAAGSSTASGYSAVKSATAGVTVKKTFY